MFRPGVQAYISSGNLKYALDQLRVAADYLLAASVDNGKYVAQVRTSLRSSS